MLIKPKKSLSQNFLIDKNISNKIINLSNIKDKFVIEIGPGYGALTDVILDRKPYKIILIEKDKTLSEILKKKYTGKNNLEILNEDILKYDFSNYKDLVVISNLPYNISSKIILYLFNFKTNINEMVLMLQKEVAHKFDYNLPIMNKYKFLTKIVSNYSQCFDISSNVFIPKPKIKSTVVKFIFKNKKYDIKKIYKFSNLIFKNVRKKIYKNIKLDKSKNSLLNKRVNEINIDELLEIYNIF